MEKREVIAQVLYYMAVHEKTQKRCFLYPKKKKALFSQLTWFETFIEWLPSETPLSYAQTQTLVGYILSHPDVFPAFDAETVEELNTKGYQMACQSIWKPDWDEIILRMKELLACTRKMLSQRRTFSNRVWIRCFMSFHNLPRVFFSPAHQGIWKEPFPPLDPALALQAASHFSLQG